MMQEIKLIVCDIDGTLANRHNVIPAANINSLQQAHQAGIKIALCSGRQAADMIHVAESLQIHNVAILSLNGSYCLTLPDGKIFHNCCFEHSALWNCISRLETLDIAYNCFSGNVLINNKKPDFENDPSFWNEERRRRRKLITHLYGMKEIKKYALQGINKFSYVNLHDPDTLQFIKRQLMTIDNVEITSSWKCNVEIMPKGINKGISITILANMYGIQKSEILSFGDNENDISLFAHSGISVCMANGTNPAKKAAMYATLSNDEAGVAHFLKRLEFLDKGTYFTISK